MKKSVIWENFSTAPDEKEMEELLDDPVLLAVGRLMRDCNDRTAVVQPKELRKLDTVYRLMEELCAGEDVQVSYRLHEPYKFFGAVIVLAKSLRILEPKLLREALKMSDNLEVSPCTDGRVQLDFGFNRLTKPLN